MAEPASEVASDIEGGLSVLEVAGIGLSCGSEQGKPAGGFKQLPPPWRASFALQ
jgi:hypothetical protein